MKGMWTTKSFLEAFQAGNLGNKSQYGSYYAVALNGFKVLMFKRKGSERPIALEHNGFCVFSRLWESSRGRGTGFEPELTLNVEISSNIEDFELIDSLSVDDNIFKLFRMNSEQFVTDYIISNVITVKEFKTHHHVYDAMKPTPVKLKKPPQTIVKLSDKVNTVREAWESHIPKECDDDTIFYKYNFIKPMPKDWKPKEEQHTEILKWLEAPPMPWHYDIPLSMVAYNSDDIGMKINPLIHLNMVVPSLRKGIEQYTLAVNRYNDQMRQLLNKYNPALAYCADLSLHPALSLCVHSEEGTYIKGVLSEKTGYPIKFSQKIDLSDRWYKLFQFNKIFGVF